MDRTIVWPGAIPLETDLLNSNKYALIGLSKLAAAILGTSTLLNGLACTPDSPASLNVSVAPGEIYSLQNIDGTAYSSLAADTTHQIVKQGVRLDSSLFSCPAPGTAGQSINYLIQVTYTDTDSGSTVLPYYNASNPAQAYSGPNNSGTAQNTVRKGVCTVAVKAGVAAATGSQTTPTPDAGYVGAWVVTVANGQTTITSGNIALYSGAPFITETLTQKIGQATGDARYAPIAYTQFGGVITVDTAISASDSGKFFHLASGIATLPAPADGLRFRFFGEGIASPSGSIASPASVGMGYPDGTAVTAGTIAVGKYSTVDVESAGGSWYITNTSGQVLTKAATASSQAVNFGQVLGLGQTWQDLLSSRALGTTYYNTTGKPISVFVSSIIPTGGTITITVGGVVAAFTTNGQSANNDTGVCAIVPPGASYVASGGTLSHWQELR